MNLIELYKEQAQVSDKAIKELTDRLPYNLSRLLKTQGLHRTWMAALFKECADPNLELHDLEPWVLDQDEE